MASESSMGCPFSLLRRMSRSLRRRNHITDRLPTQQAAVSIGTDVQTDMQPLIFFILGGPGSRKGVFVDCLVSCFNFEYIVCYDQTNIERNQMESILSRLASEIRKKEAKRYLVDVMVASKKSSLDSTCGHFMQIFEKEYPISCLINLYVELVDTSVTLRKGMTQGDMGDEADAIKLKKRASCHRNSVKHILNYFQQHNKLISIHLSTSPDSLIWKTAYRVLGNVRVKALKCTHLVIVFDNGELTNVESLGGSFHHIEPAISITQHPSLEDFLEKIVDMMDKGGHHKYILNITRTPLYHNQNRVETRTKCSVMFENEAPLKEESFKSLTSVSNETFVFPSSFPTSLCLSICHTVSHLRRSRSTCGQENQQG